MSTYRWFRSPMADWRFRCYRCPFLDQRTMFNDRNSLKFGGYDFSRFLGSSHRWFDHLVPRNLQRFKAIAGELCLLFACKNWDSEIVGNSNSKKIFTNFSKISLQIRDARQIVLSMPDEDEMTRCLRLCGLHFLVELVLIFWRRIALERFHYALWVSTKLPILLTFIQHFMRSIGSYWSQLVSHFASGGTTVLVVHELETVFERCQFMAK